MFNRLLTFGLCSLLSSGVAAAQEPRKTDQEIQFDGKQIAQSPAAAMVTTSSTQPRETDKADDTRAQAIRDADSWIRWPSLTDF